MAEHREPEQDSADDSALEGADFAQRESDSDTGVEIDRGVPESSELPYRVVNFRTRDEWLEWRKGKIGASDIGAIMGCSPFMTRFNLMRTKLGIYKKKSTLSMEKGIALEGHVLKMVNMRMQKQFRSVTLESVKYPWLVCQCDGFEDDLLLEIKCPSSAKLIDHIKKESSPPLHYHYQMQQQMLVAGIPVCVFAVYFQSQLYTFQVSANPEMQQDLIRESEIFCTDLELCRLNSEPRNSSH